MTTAVLKLVHLHLLGAYLEAPVRCLYFRFLVIAFLVAASAFLGNSCFLQTICNLSCMNYTFRHDAQTCTRDDVHASYTYSYTRK